LCAQILLAAEGKENRLIAEALGTNRLLPGLTARVACLQDQLHRLGLELRRLLLAHNYAYFFSHRQTSLAHTTAYSRVRKGADRNCSCEASKDNVSTTRIAMLT
jgi:hypothetical protein